MLKNNDIKLPSNRSFGIFFGVVFLAFSIYFWIIEFLYLSIILIAISSIISIVALVKPDLLRPANFVWMWLGYVLGTIISPIVLGTIFFGIFTPIGLVMRIFGRDELRLRLKKRETNWVLRDKQYNKEFNFNRQF